VKRKKINKQLVELFRNQNVVTIHTQDGACICCVYDIIPDRARIKVITPKSKLIEYDIKDIIGITE